MVADDEMRSFAYKTGWLALRGVSQRRAVELLQFGAIEPAGWGVAIDASYADDNRVVVTPPLPGVDGHWVLVAGSTLGSQVPDVALLSDRSGDHVQYFASHRVVEYHAWARASDGRVIRSFAFVGNGGELESWIGRPGPEEIEMGLPDTPNGGDDTLGAIFEADLDEASVMRMAGAWSVDPQSLEGRPSPGAPLLARLASRT